METNAISIIPLNANGIRKERAQKGPHVNFCTLVNPVPRALVKMQETLKELVILLGLKKVQARSIVQIIPSAVWQLEAR